MLFGGVYATSSVAVPGTVIAGLPVGARSGSPRATVTARVGASQTAFAMTAGLGLDIRVSKHVTFRPIEVDYYLTRLQNLRTDGDNNQNNIRYSGGFTFWFGGEKPAPVAHRQIQMKTCPDGSKVDINVACPKQNFALSLSASPAEYALERLPR